ncbi:protein spaetzle-like isoform X2 [Palaemon carinicauda]|uniref:protein spaetzle-like isoform X2 n=1 Tax=Palaemon carinicauda TaxID=392227 RepID=UPI0035B5B7D4
MDARSLLQVLLALALGASYAQDPSGSEIAFPGKPGFPVAKFNRFVKAPPVPLRVLDRPRCTAHSADPSAPCERDPEYDNVRGLVNQLLATTSDPGLSVFLNDGFTPSITHDGDRESPACVYQERLIFPLRAKTHKNDWVFVVNQENFRQAVVTEMCLGKGKPCDIGIPNTGDVSTFCRQKYVYMTMLVVGTNRLEPDVVLMPSCCVCYIRRNNFDKSSGRNLIPNRDR